MGHLYLLLSWSIYCRNLESKGVDFPNVSYGDLFPVSFTPLFLTFPKIQPGVGGHVKYSKVKYTDIAVDCLTCHAATGTHLPYRITQCYLPPGRAGTLFVVANGRDMRPCLISFCSMQNSSVLLPCMAKCDNI